MNRIFEAIKVIDYKESTFAILVREGDFDKIYYQRIGKGACDTGEVLLDAKPTPIALCKDQELSKIIKEAAGELSD